MFRITLSVLFCALAFYAQAQSTKWEAGPLVGVANYMGDLVESQTPTLKASDLSAGFFLRRNLSESWALRLQGQYSRILGDDQHFPERAERGFAFNSDQVELGVLAEWDLRGKRRYQNGYLHKTLSPYVFAGVAGLMANPKTVYSEGLHVGNQEFSNKIRQDVQYAYKDVLPVIPFGGGVRLDLSRKVSVGLETAFRAVFSDYLDGVSQSGNPEKDDWFMTTSLTFSYRFGKYKDTDGDRVFDKYDRCPTIQGDKVLAGCPDTDGDGIIDEIDQCPYQRGSQGMMGCPDRDGDGVADKDDRCPDANGPKTLSGCPDQDNDNIADIDDVCPELMGVLSAKGCPDSDLDSIPDAQDRCPKEAGLAVNQGCPDRDTDGDGMVDRLDACPDKAGLKVFDGCPDSDGDGIVDAKDRCPSSAGTAANNGCPEVKADEKAVLLMAMKGVQFDPAKSTLKKTSYAILDKVVEILKKYPEYNLYINGHTDSDGNDDKNMTLSESRAQTCLDYLVSKGIDKKRLTAKGFGETKPLAPNTTKANKATNRRVEFDLSLPK